MLKEEIKELMIKIGQEFLYEDDFYLEFSGPNFDANIVFEFNVEGLLCNVYY